MKILESHLQFEISTESKGSVLEINKILFYLKRSFKKIGFERKVLYYI